MPVTGRESAASMQPSYYFLEESEINGIWTESLRRQGFKPFSRRYWAFVERDQTYDSHIMATNVGKVIKHSLKNIVRLRTLGYTVLRGTESQGSNTLDASFLSLIVPLKFNLGGPETATDLITTLANIQLPHYDLPRLPLLPSIYRRGLPLRHTVATEPLQG